MTKLTRLQHAIDALVAEIGDGFRPAPERISTVIPQRLLTDWRWSPSLKNIVGKSPWLHATGQVILMDREQSWAVCVDGLYRLRTEDYRITYRRLAGLPRPDVDVGPVPGSTADLTDAEMKALFAAKTPAEHDYPHDDDEN